VSERDRSSLLERHGCAGLAANNGKRGYQITERGLDEIASSKIIERVGFLSAKIDQMTYRMNFDLSIHRPVPLSST
jgi:repressor of nif and glnA expression